jgi:argininosuccinate lyase
MKIDNLFAWMGNSLYNSNFKIESIMLRDGRLGEGVDEVFSEYSSSLVFDFNLFEYDIFGSAAHVIMLKEKRIIPAKDAKKILSGLSEILAGGIICLDMDPDAEDIHMVIEEHLTGVVGDAGGRMHTARSRNDQVSVDLRMWLRDCINDISSLMIDLQEAILAKASGNTGTIMPGFTHLQHAQPTTYAHHLLSHYDSLGRDLGRLTDLYMRVNRSPLGAGALATTSFPIDRHRTAELLGFDGLHENSQDAVGSRDVFLEALSDIAILMTTLGRMAEEMILWSTFEFGYVELPSELTSTSSIMPQKKNPDSMELLRAKSARTAGNLTSALTLMKALPYAYNRDLQELSPLVSDSLEMAETSLVLMDRAIRGVKVNKRRMAQMAGANYSTATELADLLVRKARIPFRTAHRIVGRTVAEASKKGVPLTKMSRSIKSIYKEETGHTLTLTAGDMKAALDPRGAVDAKAIPGGPAPRAVKKALAQRKKALTFDKKAVSKRISSIERSQKMLMKMMGA